MVREGAFEYRPRQIRKGTRYLDGIVGEGHSQCQGPEAGTFLVHLKNKEAVQRGGKEAAGLGQQELWVPGQCGCSLQMHEWPVEGFTQKVMGSDL